MFGDPVQNNKNLRTQLLSKVCFVKAGPFGSSIKKEIYFVIRMVCPTLQRPNLGLEQVQEYTVCTAVSPTNKGEADFNLGRDGYEDGTEIHHVTNQEALNGNSPGPRPFIL